MSRYRYFAIFGAMRTGSNLLERSLDRHEALVGLGEVFNPHFIGGPGGEEAFGLSRAARDADPKAFLERMIAAHPGQIPGFRIFDGHDARMLDHAARDPDCAKIILTREPVESFVSLKIAQETGQWMLRKEENRRLARIRFDPDEFIAYRDRLATHYALLRATMRAAGQAPFVLDYTDLNDLAALNGAAAFVGATDPQERLKPRIRRQNPEALADRVSNPEDAAPFLGAAAPAAAASAPRPGETTALDDMTVSRGLELVFAPVAGAGIGLIRGLIEDAERAAGREGRPLVTGLKAAQLERRRGRGTFVFSFIAHPATRIAHVYRSRILGDDGARFATARMVLARDYGWRRDERGFQVFLRFVEDNLAGRTAAPMDPAWARQTELLAAYAAETPIDFVGRLERLEADLAYILRRIGAPGDNGALVARAAAQAKARTAPAPGEAAEAEIQRIYRRDYCRLGYAPLPRS